MEKSPNEPLISLELLIPWELPLDQHLSSNEGKRIEQALRQLLQALAHPSPQEALMDINQALAELGKVETQVASVGSTKTALKAWEVEDYDRYFQIRHVHTEQSATCLVRGLLITCQRFMMIHIQTPWLDATQIQQQKQGFVSYTQLLMRVFDLDNLDD
ncbi:MAG: hypothetical protein VKK04_10620 [Synechococcales bacterium]|nr:hypothetical protein [Synechococcales bacterium]